jgi:hypothetical protein
MITHDYGRSARGSAPTTAVTRCNQQSARRQSAPLNFEDPHMTFPALTVGLCVLLVLVVLLAVVCAVYVRTGNPLYLQITVSEEDLSPSASA